MKDYGALDPACRPLLLAIEDALKPVFGALGTRVFLANVTGLSASRVEKVIYTERQSRAATDRIEDVSEMRRDEAADGLHEAVG